MMLPLKKSFPLPNITSHIVINVNFPKCQFVQTIDDDCVSVSISDLKISTSTLPYFHSLLYLFYLSRNKRKRFSLSFYSSIFICNCYLNLIRTLSNLKIINIAYLTKESVPGKVDEKATQLHAIASLKVLLDATKPQRGAATSSAANHVKINLKETTLSRPNGSIDAALETVRQITMFLRSPPCSRSFWEEQF